MTKATSDVLVSALDGEDIGILKSLWAERHNDRAYICRREDYLMIEIDEAARGPMAWRPFQINAELHARQIIPAPPKPLTKRQKRRLRGKGRP